MPLDENEAEAFARAITAQAETIDDDELRRALCWAQDAQTAADMLDLLLAGAVRGRWPADGPPVFYPTEDDGDGPDCAAS